jgi:hypothetical protein
MKAFTVEWFTAGWVEAEHGKIATFSNVEAADALAKKLNIKEVNSDPEHQKLIESRNVQYYVSESEVFDTLQEYEAAY